MIELRHLSKSFGTVRAVEDISLVAQDGQITGLLGPNGAGKSTTIRMIYGLITPDFGTAIVDGIVAVEDPLAVRRCIGALPDSYGLYPRLTARENIAYFGSLQGLEGKMLQHRIDELSELLDMQDILSRRVDGFSQGQRMKRLHCSSHHSQPQKCSLGRTYQWAGRHDHSRHETADPSA